MKKYFVRNSNMNWQDNPIVLYCKKIISMNIYVAKFQLFFITYIIIDPKCVISGVHVL